MFNVVPSGTNSRYTTPAASAGYQHCLPHAIFATWLSSGGQISFHTIPSYRFKIELKTPTSHHKSQYFATHNDPGQQTG
jgi:hypothetical protein